MLDPAEATRVAAFFGASDSQIRRDHLLSRLLAAAGGYTGGRILFFGGTALARAYVPDGRLAEDFDLVALDDRRQAAMALEALFIRGVRREYPRLRWAPTLTSVRDTGPAVLVTPEGWP